ncbi:MAG: hypothetical protein J7L23_01680 [Candidatus Diapherotrites archaeon]|nr:hypothetical protein [Candidatus Diapherotrites archaeon]
MKFKEAEFGRLVFGDKEFREDLVVSNGEAYPRGPREDNHLITLSELKSYLKSGTRKVVVGNGFMGALRVSQDARKFLAENNIELVVTDSKKAIELYNSEKDKKGVLAIIHSTC